MDASIVAAAGGAVLMRIKQGNMRRRGEMRLICVSTGRRSRQDTSLVLEHLDLAFLRGGS